MDTSLAPGYVRITYDGSLFPHHMTIPVNPDGTPTPGVEPDILLKGASSLGVEAAIAAFITVTLPFFKSTTGFGLAEMHTVDPTSGLDTFIWAWDVGLSGSGSGTNVPTGQTVFSFKTVAGGAYRLYLLEGLNAPNQKMLPPYPAGIEKTLSDFVIGSTSPVYGRGNSYPLVPVSDVTKLNDKLRRQQGLA